MLGLYLHVPFCEAICGYCNFNRGLFDAALVRRYVPALEREIRDAGRGELVDSVFLGGGTPSLFEPASIRRLIDACRQAYALSLTAEITLEANPETVTPERIDGFLRAGVNRISFGAQSFNDRELARLDRIHSAARARGAIHEARAAGCDNLSLDLMFWLPGQTIETWRSTLQTAIALEPDHLSLYLLELYPNSPLREAMVRAGASGRPDPPIRGASDWAQSADDEAADMYLEAMEALEAAGLVQYEISNVSRSGRQCIHNLKYWRQGSWRGFGCGAHSTVDGIRWHNVAETTAYIDRIEAGGDVRVGREVLTPSARRDEALFLGLRLSEGIDRDAFARLHGEDPWQVHAPTFEAAADAGHVWHGGARFGLTRTGMLVANEILAALL